VIGAGFHSFIYLQLQGNSRAPIHAGTLPPPCFDCNKLHYSAFFLTVRLGLAGASTATGSLFFEAVRLRRALMAVLFRLTPYDPFERFPFLDFLSPLPMQENLCGNNSIRSLNYKMRCI